MEACQTVPVPVSKTADKETHEGGCVHVHDPSFQWAKIARNTAPECDDVSKAGRMCEKT